MSPEEIRLKALELAMDHGCFGLTAICIADDYYKFIRDGKRDEPKPTPKAKKRKVKRA